MYIPNIHIDHEIIRIENRIIMALYIKERYEMFSQQY